MKVGDLVKLHRSTRRNGQYANKLALVIDLDSFNNLVIKVNGEVKSFHRTQVDEVISESR